MVPLTFAGDRQTVRTLSKGEFAFVPDKPVAVAIDGITEAAKDFCADWIAKCAA